ncbi:3-phosphoshikimate 1-carboxyvinyltransferase [Pseudoalteromonas espejiana]
MSNIKKDPAIRSLLNRMPESVQNSFTEEQLVHLKIAIGARQWGRHAIDFRGVVKFFKYRYYYVLLAGRNRRELSVNEEKIAGLLQILIISLITLVTIVVLMLIAYLFKSALGINILENYSLGLWDYIIKLFE